MWRGPWENIVYEFILTSPAVSYMSCSSNFDGFLDRWYVTVQLLFCGMLLPGFQEDAESASMWCIHIVVLTQVTLWKNCVLFYRIGLTSIWPVDSCPCLDNKYISAHKYAYISYICVCVCVWCVRACVWIYIYIYIYTDIYYIIYTYMWFAHNDIFIKNKIFFHNKYEGFYYF